MKEYLPYMVLPILSFTIACGVVWMVNNSDINTEDETCVECKTVDCDISGDKNNKED